MNSFRNRFIAFVLMLALPALSQAADAFTLKVLRDGNELYVVLANTNDQPIKVRRDFLLDRLIGNLTFEIRGHGKDFPDTSHINPVVPTESTYVVLVPGQLTGSTFNLQLIRRAHVLPKGCYTISAIYHDGMAKEFSAFDGEVKSKPIPLCVGE